MWVCPAHLTEAFFKKKPLLLTLCLLTACPWTLAPGFLPNSETTAPKQLHQPLQHSPLLQAQAVQERAGRRTSPCFWAKKGVSRKHLSEAGVGR